MNMNMRKRSTNTQRWRHSASWSPSMETATAMSPDGSTLPRHDPHQPSPLSSSSSTGALFRTTVHTATPTRLFQSSHSFSFQNRYQDRSISTSNRSSSGRYNNNNNNKSTSSTFFRRHLVFPLGLLLAVAPWIYHSSINWKIRSLKSSIVIIHRESKKLTDQLDTYTMLYRKQKDQILSLERDNSELLQSLSVSGQKDHDVVDVSSYQEAVEWEDLYIQRIDSFEAAIQGRSKRRGIETYGDGPYLVNVTLTEASLLPPQQNRQQQDLMGSTNGGDDGNNNGQRWILIETAPIRLMPHAVDHFLRMIEVQLWDGLSLSAGVSLGGSSHSNLIHTTEVSAQTNQYLKRYYETRAENGNHQTSLAFAEHSVDYPMDKYSVVFEGRPGGPNFYIHMGDGDNSNNSNKEQQNSNRNAETTNRATTTTTTSSYSKMDHHYSHHHHSEACFGRVVQGREVLDHFLEQVARGSNPSSNKAHRGHHHHHRPRMLGIESIRVVSPLAPSSSSSDSSLLPAIDT